MKKIILVLVLILAAAAAYAGTGTATMYPASIIYPVYHPVMNIIYSPGPAAGFSGGAIAVQIPPVFSPPPSTSTADMGVLSAKILLNGLTWTAVSIDPANIAIEYFSVTITALILNPADVLVITYGNSTGGGLYGSATPGAYAFNVSEKRAGTGAFTGLDKQPVLYVSNISIDKSCSAISVKAGDTFTYTITCHNSDGGNAMTNLTVWDTMPPGVMFMGAVPSPSAYAGTCYSWNLGSINANGTNTITIIAKANQGIINYGKTCVNNASVDARNVSSVYNIMSFSKAIDVQGVILQSSITAAPDVAVTGSHITVIMNVTNAGNLQSGYVTPLLVLKNMGGNAALATGPVPPVLNMLYANSSGTFTWIYTATAAGTVAFTGHASALEGTAAVVSSDSTGNYVIIINPTPTSTAVIPAATVTATAVVIVPTNTPVVIPTSVSGEKVFTDKNYMKQSAGDRIRIYYEAPGAGKLEITVFNLSGEKIRYFVREYDLKKYDYMDWDGKNEALKPAGKGLYFILVKMNKWQHMKKVVILK